MVASGHASVCACERWRPCERPTCECSAVDPHLALISGRNAPLSLQKHLFRPSYVTEVCKTECCHPLFRLKNVTLRSARGEVARLQRGPQPEPGCC